VIPADGGSDCQHNYLEPDSYIAEGVHGLVIGDKGCISAFVKAKLATVGIDLQTRLRANMTDPRPLGLVRQLTQPRRLVETVIVRLIPFPNSYSAFPIGWPVLKMPLWERPSGRDGRGLKPRSYKKSMQNRYNGTISF